MGMAGSIRMAAGIAGLGAAVAGIVVTAPRPMAAESTAKPARIVLVKGETGLALGSLRWTSGRRASGELDMTGEGAADLGKVTVTVSRDQGAITSLRLAGKVTVAKSWTFAHGQWSAS